MNQLLNRPTNRLSREKSPYLQQHAHNPIDWFPWGEEAFAYARKENRLIFLSVGYSTCHWCHVMERESFEDAEVAQFMNENFVAIKVDREERPDVDSIYMSAIQAMSGQGGWPMSVFLTPDLKPFFGGTYFQKPRFLWSLKELNKQWRTEPERILEAGEQLFHWLEQNEPKAGAPTVSVSIFKNYFSRLLSDFDFEKGGKSGAPKFPMSSDLRMLLRIHRRTGESRALQMVEKTLHEMSRGGIYDALGGGFHRYSTDPDWLVPHFEKMLYDQASLTQALVEAYQVTKNPEFRAVAVETLDYVLREMTSPGGGFYSAEDADSEGEEGKFYVWSMTELREFLPEERLKEFVDAFGVTDGGNFEHGANILTLQEGQTRQKRTESLRETLLELRKKRNLRPHPLRDEKVIASWNGLMIAAMAKAGRVFSEPRFVEGATKALDFVWQKLRQPDGRLLRRWIEGEAAHPAFLDDYAFLIDGCLEIYFATFDERWVDRAEELQARQDEFFLDPKEGNYYFSSEGDASLIQRQKEFFDNVQPAGNSVSALNLARLSALTFEPAYLERLRGLCAGMPEALALYPWAFPHFLLALDGLTDLSQELAIVSDDGKSVAEALLALADEFLPNLVFASGQGTSKLGLLRGRNPSSGKSTYFVCSDQTCQAPTTDWSLVLADLRRWTPYSL